MRVFSLRGAMSLLALMCATGCEPDFSVVGIKAESPGLPVAPRSMDPGTPQLDVDPPAIEFGYVPEGTTVDGTFTVTNIGRAPLELVDVHLAGDPAFSSAATDIVLAPDEQVALVVSYLSTASDGMGALLLDTNDAAQSSLVLVVTGTGADPQVVSTDLDFGYVRVDEVVTLNMPLFNPGNARVRITGIDSSEGHFEALLSAPLVLDPGMSAEVPVTFTPEDVVAYAGRLRVHSTAREPVRDFTTTGHGARLPVAVCEAVPPIVTPIHESFSFHGSGSYDLMGRPLVAQWTLLQRPAGSTFTLGATTTLDIGTFVADMVGDYTAELVVMNDLGLVSEPCIATVAAEPNADLWVELFWSNVDDLDLHLVQGGSAMRSGGDCYYGNCINGLAWDSAGTADDPYLDLDDIHGLGPENINIAAPSNSTYRVVVHDFPGTSFTGANSFTVRVYLEGALALEAVRSVSGEDATVDVALIDLTSATPTVTPL